MTPKERFHFELLKLIISYHDEYAIDYDELVKVLKNMVIDAEDAMEAGSDSEDEWFDEWLTRQAS